MIRCLNLAFRAPSGLEAVPEAFRAHPNDRMLIQVFSGVLETERIQEVIAAVRAVFPEAPLIGATTAGEILEGQATENSVVVSITCFDSSTVKAALVAQNEDLSAAGHELGARLRQPSTKVLIVLGCGIKDKRTIFGEALLDALREELPEVAISGGQAGDNGKGVETMVFTAEGITGHGVAAVSIAGSELSARNAYTLSWVPIGKTFTITRAEGSRVYSIDGQPPYDLYCHYLGQEVADGLPLSAADFPLMIERDGTLMAIHATGVNPDGSFNYIHNFQAGEQLRFGYCHAGLLALGAERLYEELYTSKAQAAFIYSCVSRKWILGVDVLVELAPIERLAPSAGFFCYGEYFGRPSSSPLFLSQTLTVLCLSEGGALGDAEQTPDAGALIASPHTRQFQTMRVLHRLVETSAREIEMMNLELATLARKDSLTGMANRRSLDERLSLELQRKQRTNSPLSLILVDVDHFKLYNDTYGHVRGDECLRAVAKVLLGGAQRASDLAARYGGEEFAIIIPDTPFDYAMRLAERLRAGVEQLRIPHSASATSEWVTVSLGLVTIAHDVVVSPEGLLRQCDEQLYLAKQHGRNQVSGLGTSVKTA